MSCDNHKQLVEQKLREQAVIARGTDEANNIFRDVMAQKQIQAATCAYNQVPAKLPRYLQESKADDEIDKSFKKLIKSEQDVSKPTVMLVPLRDQCLRSKAWRLAYLQSKANAQPKERTQCKA